MRRQWMTFLQLFLLLLYCTIVTSYFWGLKEVRPNALVNHVRLRGKPLSYSSFRELQSHRISHIRLSSSTEASQKIHKELNGFQVLGYFFKWCLQQIQNAFLSKFKDRTTELLKKNFIIFINRKAGGKQGKMILRTLQQVLQPSSYCDLSKESVKEKLSELYKEYNNHTLAVCCGGDGTIRWVMDVARDLEISQNITFGIIPLGTGNDLFNHFIDSQYSKSVLENMAIKHLLTPTTLLSNPMLTFLLFRLPYRTVSFDRWEVVIEPTIKSLSKSQEKTETSVEAEEDISSKKGTAQQLLEIIQEKKQLLPPPDILLSSIPFLSKRKTTKKSFNNYFGIGVDGDITHTFDYFRKQTPYLFFHPIANKIWYAIIWIYKFVRRSQKNLSDGSLTLSCDGRIIDLSKYPQLSGIIFTNIGSYAGGSKLWQFGNETKAFHDSSITVDEEESIEKVIEEREKDTQQESEIQPQVYDKDLYGNIWRNQFSDDGIIEAVGITDLTHLAQIKGGLAKPIPLAQGRKISLQSKIRLPMQCDGEPWIQKACTMEISNFERVNLLEV